MDNKTLYSVEENLQLGLLDFALKTIGTQDKIPDEFLNNKRIKKAAARGIGMHLLDSRGDGDIETAMKIRDLFHIPNEMVREDSLQGIENWTGDKGSEFGRKICLAFDIPPDFMESEIIQNAKRRYEHLHAEHEQQIKK